MPPLLEALLPELVLCVVACALFLMGAAPGRAVRKAVPFIAMAALIAVFGYQIAHEASATIADSSDAVRIFAFADYIKLIASGVGIVLMLLAWPTNEDATGNGALEYGRDAGEFFALMLLSIAGVFLVAGANDIILLFLGIELASIPTYIMVSVSRPIPVAQEAGVKYFFLGAMAAALMLFGFSYLYGTTGLIHLDDIARRLGAHADASAAPQLTPWQTLAVLMLVLGFSFKIAAVPLHFYAGDVYQGAATPVTAFLSFVPKTAGMVALIKLIFAVSGGGWNSPEFLVRLLWIMAALTMTAGNVLGLLQFNVKRVLAYSSIAHSGYMLVGLTAAAGSHGLSVAETALQGVLFYLAAYGIMNAAAFGVLMLLPARQDRFRPEDETEIPPATTAETFEDLAGQGRRHPMLGLAMAVSCFSLIGIPLTVGFFGKLLLIRPALDARMYWLVVIMVINAAISAGYYLRIVGTMLLRSDAGEAEPVTEGGGGRNALPIMLSVSLSVFVTLLLGIVLPATQVLTTQVSNAVHLESGDITQPVAEVAGARAGSSIAVGVRGEGEAPAEP